MERSRLPNAHHGHSASIEDCYQSSEIHNENQFFHLQERKRQEQKAVRLSHASADQEEEWI